jgi:uncharacterized membrane protein YdjX (TVP38/TMEM64 family)
MLLAYFTGVTEALSFENLREQRSSLVAFVEERPVAAPAAYIAVYIFIVALSIPGAVFITLFGGFLFPQPYATLYTVVGATIGASCIFLAAKTALGDLLKEKAGPLLKKMEAGFHENAASYLLFLRLVPVFPFWLVNLAPALFGIPLRTFIWTTFFGIMPGTFVFTQAGTGLGAIFDSGEELNLATIFNNDIKIALVALGLFALLPLLIKRFRKNKEDGSVGA